MTAPYTLSRPHSISRQEHLLLTSLRVLGASLFIGLCAQIAVPLPFSPVPLTCQTLAVMLVGATMGSRLGTLSVLLYIMEGCMGLPVWAQGFAGILPLVGPKAGYIVGYVFQAYIIGWFMERRSGSNTMKMMTMLLLSCVVQMGMGTLWLANFVGWDNTMLMGVYPFIPGEVLKAAAVVAYLKNR